MKRIQTLFLVAAAFLLGLACPGKSTPPNCHAVCLTTAMDYSSSMPSAADEIRVPVPLTTDNEKLQEALRQIEELQKSRTPPGKIRSGAR